MTWKKHILEVVSMHGGYLVESVFGAVLASDD